MNDVGVRGKSRIWIAVKVWDVVYNLGSRVNRFLSSWVGSKNDGGSASDILACRFVPLA